MQPTNDNAPHPPPSQAQIARAAACARHITHLALEAAIDQPDNITAALAILLTAIDGMALMLRIAGVLDAEGQRAFLQHAAASCADSAREVTA
jgi:hypothetical protein